MKRLGLVLLLLLVAAGLATAGYVLSGGRGQATKYRTARVDRGTIIAAVSATGNVNAVTTVLVGSQVSGQIKEIRVDFNSPVEKGQLIARLDPEIFAARVNAARADVESAQAAVLNQQANVEKVRADVENGRAATVTAEANVERMRADVGKARGGAVPGPGVPGPAGLRPGRAAGRRGPAQGGRGERPAEAGRPRSGPRGSRAHRDPRPGERGRRLPERGRGPDGGGQPPGADPLHHRPGPDPDAGRGRRGRGGHRPPARGPAGHLHRGRLPRAHLPGADRPDPQGAPGRAERGDLHHGDRRVEPGADPDARDDGQCPDPGGPQGRRPAAPERGAPLPAARGDRRADRRPGGAVRRGRERREPG